MEVDSVHSCIENKIKNKAIHLPSDYGRYTKEARVRGVEPYELKEISYNFVKDYALISLVKYPSIRPGKKTNDPTVNEIKVIKYTPDGTIQAKLSFYGEFLDLPGRITNSTVANLSDFPQLRKEPIKIKYTKWQHLQQLKEVIPLDCGPYYDNLLHEEKAIKENKETSVPEKGNRKKNNKQSPSKGKKRTQPLQPVFTNNTKIINKPKGGKKYSWCLCGRSKKQPICDGTHKIAQLKITHKPVRFEVEESKEYWICNCKQTKNRPFCDGTHKSKEVQDASSIIRQ
ncbi:unnamed protein product [Psylliodes chrysocephalus]|uniref:Iron-binding zinc finger CDGSH type domain-containing protein n=1 Tax=Psylliodes chrysocephalus TaxID=3402493 RepID=A0A9P0GAE2_9CUCU|nr:unnamed protein product [Psylliodes chrysocephala]